MSDDKKTTGKKITDKKITAWELLEDAKASSDFGKETHQFAQQLIKNAENIKKQSRKIHTKVLRKEFLDIATAMDDMAGTIQACLGRLHEEREAIADFLNTINLTEMEIMDRKREMKSDVKRAQKMSDLIEDTAFKKYSGGPSYSGDSSSTTSGWGPW